MAFIQKTPTRPGSRDQARRPARRRARLAIVSAVAGVLVGGIVPQPAQADAPDPVGTVGARGLSPEIAEVVPLPVAWTHNLSGGTIHRGRLEALDPLKFWITVAVNKGQLPLVVGIQEACEGQRQELLRFLKTKNEHYTMARWTARTGEALCQGQDYGSAVYVIGGETVAHEPFDAQQLDPGVAFDTRGFVCQRSVFGYVGCTAHLICRSHCGDGEVAARIRLLQFSQYANRVAQLRRQFGPVYWGGDLYIPPRQMVEVFPNILLFNQEADEECGGGPTDWRPTEDSTDGSSGEKVDWLFLFGPAREPCVRDAFIWPTDHQDHHLVASYYTP
jgi:hypothetical protein